MGNSLPVNSIAILNLCIFNVNDLYHLNVSTFVDDHFLTPQRLYRRKPGMAAVASKLPQNLVKNRYRDISACKLIMT